MGASGSEVQWVGGKSCGQRTNSPLHFHTHQGSVVYRRPPPGVDKPVSTLKACTTNIPLPLGAVSIGNHAPNPAVDADCPMPPSCCVCPSGKSSIIVTLLCPRPAGHFARSASWLKHPVQFANLRKSMFRALSKHYTMRSPFLSWRRRNSISQAPSATTPNPAVQRTPCGRRYHLASCE